MQCFKIAEIASPMSPNSTTSRAKRNSVVELTSQSSENSAIGSSRVLEKSLINTLVTKQEGLDSATWMTRN